MVLMRVEGPVYGGKNDFVRSGENVYRRIGTGNFGKSIDMLNGTELVLALGTYGVLGNGQVGQSVMRGFKRKEERMQEFVLI